MTSQAGRNDNAAGNDLILRMQGVSKTFGGTRALQDVDFAVRSGEVHALVGHNGSGKSTLIKILSGYHRPDLGAEIVVDGRPARQYLVTGANDSQLRFVHQDLGLVLELSATENLAIRNGFQRGRLGQVNWAQQRVLTEEMLRRFSIDIDVGRPLSEATPVQREIVAIAAALQNWDDHRGILVLDEPTAILPRGEVELLFQTIRDLQSRGTSVVYVSHRLEEVFSIADRVTVLRGGRRIATRAVDELSKSELITLILGEDASEGGTREKTHRDTGPVALEVRNLSGRYLRGAAIAIRAGEIVGLAGLPGSGRDELPYAVAGVLGAQVNGQVRIPHSSPSWVEVGDHLRDEIAFVPADRGTEGLIEEMTVGENLSLGVLDRIRKWTLVNKASERAMVTDWLDRLLVQGKGPEDPIRVLSGGSQQKVLIGRSLATNRQILILCEPTAGVDIGARRFIYEIIRAQADRGLAVLVASTDLDELLTLCDRIAVLQDGVVSSDLVAASTSEHKLLNAIETRSEHQQA